MAMKVFNRFSVEVDGSTYRGTTQRYGDEHYTASWICIQMGEAGELGYGVGDCYAAELEASAKIRSRHQLV